MKKLPDITHLKIWPKVVKVLKSNDDIGIVLTPYYIINHLGEILEQNITITNCESGLTILNNAFIQAGLNKEWSEDKFNNVFLEAIDKGLIGKSKP